MNAILIALFVVSLCNTANAGLSGAARGPLVLQNGGTDRDKTLVMAASVKTKSNDMLAASSANFLAAFLTRHGGAACIMGGVMAHFIFGSLYCSPNFATYSPPSLRFFDGLQHEGQQSDLNLCLPLTLVAQCFAMPVGTIVVKSLGPRKTMLLGSLIVSAGVFLSSYANSLATFLFFYSIVFGIGVGLGYTAPMIAGWKWMPQSKGLVSGGILTGFGAGGFIFNLVGTMLANPKGLNPVNGAFPQEVYDNFPKMLRTLATIYMIMSLVASSLISEPGISATLSSPSQKISQPEVPGIGVADALKTPQFWLMWCMIAMSAGAGLNVASTYKSFAVASPALSGDGFQALVGGLGALANGFGRIFWGTLSDKIGFKQSFAILTLLQALVHAYYPATATSKPLFAIFTCLCYFFLAGNFALMPPSIQKLYGPLNGSLIYGLIYSAFGTASIGSTYMNKLLKATLGYDGVFKVLSLFSIMAAMLTSQLQPLKSFPGSTI